MNVIAKRYRQEPHAMADRDAELSLRLEDNGAGEYLVLDATEWSIEDEAELDALVEQMREMLARARE